MSPSVSVPTTEDLDGRLDTLSMRITETHRHAIKIPQISQDIKVINLRLDGIDTRLDTIDTRLDSMDGKLDSIDTRFDSIDAKLDADHKLLIKIAAALNIEV